MAITVNAIKCPNCGANLPVEEGREKIYCSFCGTPIIITNENEHIYRNIDEARIKESETERLIRLRELELEEKEDARGRRSLFIEYGIALVFVLGGALISIFKPGAGMLGVIIGLYIVVFAYLKNVNKEKKHKYVGANDVAITAPMVNHSGKNYNSVVMLFRGGGFSNVTAVPLNDLNLFTAMKNGQVEDVTINGSSDFSEGDVYNKSSNVLITYHSTR